MRSVVRPAPSPPEGIACDSRAYLAEYYSRVEPTEKLTLRFLNKALSLLPAGSCALDFGAGPTLHHAVALAGHAREVHVADLLPQNLDALRRWQMGAADAHDWSAFTREVMSIEGIASASATQVNEREALTRRRLTRLMRGDARRRDPLGESFRGQYECVTTFFCVDSSTSTLSDWKLGMSNVFSLLAPGGLLVMAALRRCESWRIGNARLPSACVDERHMQFVLDAAGFERSVQVIEVHGVPDQAHNGFDSILLVQASGRAR